MGDHILEMRSITKTFPGVKADHSAEISLALGGICVQRMSRKAPEPKERLVQRTQ